MYDFYPEWGPARHRDDDGTRAVRRRRYWQPGPPALAMAGAAAETRDADGERPDDN